MRDKGKRTLAQGDMVSAEVIAIGIVTTILVFSLLSVVMAAGDEQHEQARRVFERQVHALHSPYTIQEDMPEDSSAASSPNGVPSFFVTQIELIDQERHGRSAWRRIAQNYEHRLLTQKDIGELVEELQNVFRFSAVGGIGGSISFGQHGGVASIQAGMTAGVAFDFTWTALKGRI